MKLYSRRQLILSAVVAGCFIALAAYGVGFYLGHGTKTPQGDTAELEALASLLMHWPDPVSVGASGFDFSDRAGKEDGAASCGIKLLGAL